MDAVLIPDDGRAIVFFEHHRVVHVEFREPELLTVAVDALERAGHALPAELPDATFKPVPWMTPKY